MGNQALGESLQNDTIRVLDAILSRYENIDYVIFAGDIDYHFQRATGSIPNYVEFFENVSSKTKSNSKCSFFSNSPEDFASVSPFFVKFISVHPVKRFSWFHWLSPCRSNTSLLLIISSLC